MSKLTLSVNPSTISRAKRYAKRHGTSVSAVVEAYLASLSDPAQEERQTPVLDSLRGILKSGSAGEHRRHLVEKYR
jgi:hypothetical protein